MSNHNCYLCASDEGILLDIFADGGKTHCEKIETCLSVKIQKRNAASTKICHKCAYELDACSKFVQKYRETRDVREGKNKRSKRCSLCSETGKKGYLFELGEGTSLNTSLSKIRELFNDNFFQDQLVSLSICLNCRYNIDVLSDLKSVYQATLGNIESVSKQKTKTQEYPKTRTSVVSRKTTYIPLPQLNGDKSYETDSSSSSAMSIRRKRGRPRKNIDAVLSFRICEQCDASVENGIDMFRYHRTGRTVCRDCWLTMDPEKVTSNKRRKLGLVLKDVLTNPSKYTNIYKVEKDEHGNTTYLIADESSESEEKEKAPVKKTRRGRGSFRTVAEEPESSTTTTPEKKKPAKRVSTSKSSEYEPPAKVSAKSKTKLDGEASTSAGPKSRNGVITSDSEVMVLRTRRNVPASTESKMKAASLSDEESNKPVPKKRGRARKNPISSPVSSKEVATASTRGRRGVQKIDSEKSDEEIHSRPLRNTRANSVTSQDTSSRTVLSTRTTKSMSEPGPRTSKTRNIKAKSASPKNAKSDTESESPYSCSVCKVEYRNKLIGMAHELTHAKQPEVKLQRVNIPEIVVEETPAEISLVEEPEEQSLNVSSSSDSILKDEKSEDTPAKDVPMETETESGPVNASSEKETEKLEESETNEVTNVEEKSIDVDAGVEKKDVDLENEDSVTVKEKDETEDKMDTAETQAEPDTSEENKKADAKCEAEKVEDVEHKETPAISELDKNNDDKVIEKTLEQEKPESTTCEEMEQTENEDEIVLSAEKPAEQESLKESSEIPVKSNGVAADHDSGSEGDEAEEEVEAEKTAAELDAATDLKIVDDSISEENIEPSNSSPLTKELPETEVKETNPEVEVKDTKSEVEAKKTNSETEEKDANSNTEVKETNSETEAKDTNLEIEEKDTNPEIGQDTNSEMEKKDTNFAIFEAVRDDGKIVESEETDKSLESTLETAPSDNIQTTGEDAQLKSKKESSSIHIATDVLDEVFDLASAEVQRRLNSEKPDADNCATPIAETVENISREIQNSADMPLLEVEPLVELQSGNNES